MHCINVHTHRAVAGETVLRTAGIHPWLAGEYEIADAAALRTALNGMLDCAQAIGETGLDFACSADKRAQERLFRAHLELAAGMHLPVVVHCVRAFEPVMKILGEYSLPAVVFHGFVGSKEQALRAVGRGYFLSFGVRSLRSARTVEAMRTIPVESLFIETDDDPTPVGEVCDAAAAMLGTDSETLAGQLYANYKRLTDDIDQPRFAALRH